MMACRVNEPKIKEAQMVSEIPDLFRVPDPILVNESRPEDSIVIDNGSYECKVGWSSDSCPRMTFRSHSTKIRGQKGSDLYVGNDISNYEASGWMPLKTPFEKNIASHPEIQEHVMDHIFTKLGFNGDRIDRPVVMTEPLCNPNYYRQYMSELLFECYDVPYVVYGIDSMLSLEYNLPQVQNAVVVALGHAVSHVIPILNGEICFKQSRRVSYGGQNISAYLQRLLQLKHPQLSAAIGTIRSEYLTHTYCKCALDYEEQVLRFSDRNYSDENTVRIQLPLNSIQASASATTTSGKMDVCYSIIQRVESVMSKKHRWKLIDSQEKLNQLLSIHELIAYDEDQRKRNKTIEDLGFDSLEDLEATIVELRHRVEATLQSDLPHEVELCHFSDPDSWLMALRKLREDLKYKISLNLIEPGRENLLSDKDMLDRVELVIFETEREFKRSSVINLDDLKSTSGISQFYQIVLGTEQYRAPEVLFQPTALLGLEQAGLVEMIDRVFHQFSSDDQNRISETVFVTGGPACLPGLRERLEREIQAILPFQSKYQIVMAKNPSLDAWHGAKMTALDSNVKHFAVTKQDYEEFGPDYIKRYKCSNIYAPSPLVVRL